MKDRKVRGGSKKSTRGFYISDDQLMMYKLGLALRNARSGSEGKVSLNAYLFEEILDREVRKEIEESKVLFGSDRIGLFEKKLSG